MVTAAFLAVALGLGALWRAAGSGMFVQHAIQTASHCIEQAAPQALADVLLH